MNEDVLIFIFDVVLCSVQQVSSVKSNMNDKSFTLWHISLDPNTYYITFPWLLDNLQGKRLAMLVESFSPLNLN